MIRNVIKTVFTVIILFVFCNFENYDVDKLREIEWLLGVWEMKSEGASIFESWTKVNDNEFEGKSFKLLEQDTITFEKISLINKSSKLFYMPTVSGQNNDQAVMFTEKEVKENYFIFENLKHDFPQIISYTLISRDSLKAEISGRINNKDIRRVFFMKRVVVKK